MNLASIFLTMLQLFLIMLVGWAGHKSGILPEATQGALTKLVLYITTPCTILNSVLCNDNLPSAGVLVELLLVSLLCYAVAGVLSFLAVRVMRIKPGARGTFMCMLMFTNCGFIGFPVVQAIFGPEAIFYTAVINIPYYPLLYGIGVWLLTRDAAVQSGTAAKVQLHLSDLLSPCILASVAAIVLALTGWKLPAVLTDTIATIGNITTPGALLVVGISIAKQPIREMLCSGKIYLMSLVRLVVLPAVIWLLLRPFLHDPMLLGVVVVVFAMPTATMVTMLAGEYHGDEPATVRGVFITTVLSMISIPILVAVMMA